MSEDPREANWHPYAEYYETPEPKPVPKRGTFMPEREVIREAMQHLTRELRANPYNLDRKTQAAAAIVMAAALLERLDEQTWRPEKPDR